MVDGGRASGRVDGADDLARRDIHGRPRGGPVAEGIGKAHATAFRLWGNTRMLSACRVVVAKTWVSVAGAVPVRAYRKYRHRQGSASGPSPSISPFSSPQLLLARLSTVRRRRRLLPMEQSCCPSPLRRASRTWRPSTTTGTHSPSTAHGSQSGTPSLTRTATCPVPTRTSFLHVSYRPISLFSPTPLNIHHDRCPMLREGTKPWAAPSAARQDWRPVSRRPAEQARG